MPPRTLTTPLLVTSRSADTPSLVAAIWSRACRADAAATRSPVAHWARIVWLPAVVPWSTVWPVMPWTILVAEKATSSSSATIWRVAVSVPVPSSTLPVETVTTPFLPIASQAPICVASGSGVPRGLAAASAEVRLSR